MSSIKDEKLAPTLEPFYLWFRVIRNHFEVGAYAYSWLDTLLIDNKVKVERRELATNEDNAGPRITVGRMNTTLPDMKYFGEGVVDGTCEQGTIQGMSDVDCKCTVLTDSLQMTEAVGTELISLIAAIKPFVDGKYAMKTSGIKQGDSTWSPKEHPGYWASDITFKSVKKVYWEINQYPAILRDIQILIDQT